jgi:hypothetical protein
MLLLSARANREGILSGVSASRVTRLATKRGQSGLERSDESGEIWARTASGRSR